MRIWNTTIAALVVVAGNLSTIAWSQQTGFGSPQQSDLRVPQVAPAQFASYSYGIGVRIARGLYYCRIPDDWAGSDHGRVFYLTPPRECDTTAGYVLGTVAEELPRIDLFYSYGVEHEFRDGLRNARTAEELVRQDCAKPRRLSGVKLLGRVAVGCETERAGWRELSVATPYRLEKLDRAIDPDAVVSVRLVTPRSRYAADRSVFYAFVSHVYLCAAQWRNDQSGQSFWLGAAAGRPECPANAFW